MYENYRRLQEKIEKIVLGKQTEGLQAVRAALESNLYGLEREHPKNIMGGKSHKYFTRRVVKLVAAQPTIKQMRATLWQYSKLEVPPNFDSARDIPVYQECDISPNRNDNICEPGVVSHFRFSPLSIEEQRMTNTM